MTRPVGEFDEDDKLKPPLPIGADLDADPHCNAIDATGTYPGFICRRPAGHDSPEHEADNGQRWVPDPGGEPPTVLPPIRRTPPSAVTCPTCGSVIGERTL